MSLADPLSPLPLVHHPHCRSTTFLFFSSQPDGALAITTLVLLASYAAGHLRLGAVLNLFGLVPSSLFGWAWFHALGMVAHFNCLLVEGVGRRWAGWSKGVFNGVMVGGTGAVVGGMTVALPTLLAHFMDRTTERTGAARKYRSADFHMNSE